MQSLPPQNYGSGILFIFIFLIIKKRINNYPSSNYLKEYLKENEEKNVITLVVNLRKQIHETE